MAAVKFYYRSSKDVGTLTLRFLHGRGIDIPCTTGVNIPKTNWDKKRQRVKNSGSLKNAAEINKKLLNLEAHIVHQFTMDFMTGEDIDSLWLKKSIAKFFGRPAYEGKVKQEAVIQKFFVPFCDNWTKDYLDTGKWKNPKTKKPIAYKSVRHYCSTIDKVRKFEEFSNRKLKNSDINVDFCQEFVTYLIEQEAYSTNYINKVITRVKFFCNRAEEKGVNINKEFRSNMFSAPIEKTKDPYLNEHELKRLFDHDFSGDDKLERARDWLIIGAHTGARVSDFLKMDASIIEGDYIHIEETEKTGATVTIPIHDYIKVILKRRQGKFPKSFTFPNFNLAIKDVCEAAGIDNVIEAGINNPETNRKEIIFVEKYKAVSSHICRRSFATNHYGKIPTADLMKIGGWATETAFLKYIKKSSFESAAELKKLWDKAKEQGHSLKIA